MPVAQVRINRPNNSASINLTLVSPPDAVWYTGYGIDYVLPDNPGLPFDFEVLNGQSAAITNLRVQDKTVGLANAGGGQAAPFSLVLSIASSTNEVTIEVDTGGVGGLYMTTPAGNTPLDLNGPPGVVVVLWVNRA